MKHNKWFKISVVEILIGIAVNLLAFTGLVKDPGVLTGAGSGIMAVGVAQLLKAARMEANPELKKRIETASKDERYAFISMKAKEAAFVIYLIIAGVISMAALILGYERLGMTAAMSICLLVILYTIMFRIMAKKY